MASIIPPVRSLFSRVLAGGAGASGPITEPSALPWSLRSATEAGLTAYFRAALGPSSKGYLGSVWATDITAATAAAPAAPGAMTSVFSGTTLQETGVDEADLVKSDGTHVFSLEQSGASGSWPPCLRKTGSECLPPRRTFSQKSEARPCGWLLSGCEGTGWIL